MPRPFLLIATLLGPAIVACVGDEPSVSAQDAGTGGSDAAPDSVTPDASTGSDGANDTGDDAPPADTAPPPRCDPKKPFGTPTLVAALNQLGANDYDARFTPDELTVFFGTTRKLSSDAIYQAQRASDTQPFGTPTELVIAGTSSSSRPASPTMSTDLLTLVVQTDHLNIPPNISLATRTSTLGGFDTPQPLTNVTSPGGNTAPYMLADKSAIYYTSISSGSSIKVSRAVNGTFQAGTSVTGIASTSTDTSPVVTPDELTIFWASDRTDADAQGGFDVWTASRATTADAFSNLVRLAELSTQDDDYPTWISPDACVIYLTSGRPAVAGGDGGVERHIWRAIRPK